MHKSEEFGEENMSVHGDIQKVPNQFEGRRDNVGVTEFCIQHYTLSYGHHRIHAVRDRGGCLGRVVVVCADEYVVLYRLGF